MQNVELFKDFFPKSNTPQYYCKIILILGRMKIDLLPRTYSVFEIIVHKKRVKFLKMIELLILKI